MAAAKPCTSLDPQQFLQEAEPLILPWVFEENKKDDIQAVLDWNMNEIDDEKFMDSVVSPKPRESVRERLGAFTWEQQHPHDPKDIQIRPETPWTVRHTPRKAPEIKKNPLNKDYHSATMCASQDCWLSPPLQGGQYERFCWEVALRPTKKPKIQAAHYPNLINFRIGFVAAAIPKGDLRGVFEPEKPGQVAVQVHVAEDRQGKVVGNDEIIIKAEGKTYKCKPEKVELDHKIGDLYVLKFDFKNKRVRLYYNGAFVTTIYEKLTHKVLPVMSITTDRGCESIMKCTRVKGVKPSDASK